MIEILSLHTHTHTHSPPPPSEWCWRIYKGTSFDSKTHSGWRLKTCAESFPVRELNCISRTEKHYDIWNGQSVATLKAHNPSVQWNPMFSKNQKVQSANLSKLFIPQNNLWKNPNYSAFNSFIPCKKAYLCQKEMFILYIYESSWGHKAAWVKISALTQRPCLWM